MKPGTIYVTSKRIVFCKLKGSKSFFYFLGWYFLALVNTVVFFIFGVIGVVLVIIVITIAYYVSDVSFDANDTKIMVTIDVNSVTSFSSSVISGKKGIIINGEKGNDLYLYLTRIREGTELNDVLKDLLKPDYLDSSKPESNLDKIKQLKALLDGGAITDAEYEEKKSEYLKA